MKMSNKTYDVLKKISLMLVPLVTFITALTEIWGFKYGSAIGMTISAFAVFMGACLTISTKNYNKEYVDGFQDEFTEE